MLAVRLPFRSVPSRAAREPRRRSDRSHRPPTPHPYYTIIHKQAAKPKAAGLALGQSVGNFFFKRGEVRALCAAWLCV